METVECLAIAPCRAHEITSLGRCIAGLDQRGLTFMKAHLQNVAPCPEVDDAACVGTMAQFLAKHAVTTSQFAFSGFECLLRLVTLGEYPGVTLLRSLFALLAQDPDGFKGETKSF